VHHLRYCCEQVPVTRRKRLVASHSSVQTNSEGRSERSVEAADALLQQTVELLSRRSPPHLLEAAAHDDLVYLRPLLEGALAAIVNIERRRPLTDEELARRHAFKMLLV
jgi:hypothetical protein